MNRQQTDTIWDTGRKATTPYVSLFYLFFTFLKLGATAFGGYMSLVAMVQKQLVDLDKKLKEEDLLDGITLTSVLPGPVAVNVIAYIGYRLRGIGGAAVAFAGIILPSFFLVLALSELYLRYGNVPAVKNIFAGITPVVTALILTVACGMARKTMKRPMQWVIGGIAALLLGTVGGFGLTVGLIFGSGLLGFILFGPPADFHSSTGKETIARPSSDDQTTGKGGAIRIFFKGFVVLALLLAVLFWGAAEGGRGPISFQIVSIFGGTSLTLFGGGYVVIPALHELFVENLHWLSSAEFADGIAIGQITPGPIFITATFIGYKVAGVGGAFLATAAMFTPPAAVTVFFSRLVGLLSDSTAVKAVMKGVRAAVIGMIFASALTIGRTMELSWTALFLFLAALAISFKYTISPVYLILGGGLAGLILF